jgi:hypothetical protein
MVFQQWKYARPTRIRHVVIGETVADIDLKDPWGNPARLAWRADPRPTFVYVFSPSCVWCTRNLQGIITVTKQQRSYRMIGLSTTNQGLSEYVKAHDLGMPVYHLENKQNRRTLKISATPSAFLISPAGVVRKVWLGAWTGHAGEEIGALFGVVLPPIQR